MFCKLQIHRQPNHRRKETWQNIALDNSRVWPHHNLLPNTETDPMPRACAHMQANTYINDVLGQYASLLIVKRQVSIVIVYWCLEDNIPFWFPTSSLMSKISDSNLPTRPSICRWSTKQSCDIKTNMVGAATFKLDLFFMFENNHTDMIFFLMQVILLQISNDLSQSYTIYLPVCKFSMQNLHTHTHTPQRFLGVLWLPPTV